MTHSLKIVMNNESLAILLRSNLSCYLGKSLTQDILNEITLQIIESIDYFINQHHEKS